MAHPSCQITGSSPKKTPQGTPAKSGNAETIETIEGTENAAVSALARLRNINIPLPNYCPVSQKFGCLRIWRFSSLLLSMGC